MISDTLEVRVICDGGVELFGREGANFSVFAIGGIAEGVSIKGGKYEADDVSLTTDGAEIGEFSNESLEKLAAKIF